jgi:transcriptional regulator with XRE-family HTH domain
MSNLALVAGTAEEKALNLLGAGVQAEQVAAALGVSPSYISQLLSQEDFSAAVSALRYESLQRHNVRDSKLDALEDAIIEKLEQTLPLVMRPMELTRMLTSVNGAKRRGTSTPDAILTKQQVVNITIPTVIKNKFVTNIHNQVVQAGEQQLVTMQSGTLLENIKATENDPKRVPGIKDLTKTG